MSDDAEEKPRKLKLSRDVKPADKEADPAQPSPAPPPASASDAAETPKPSLKLNREKIASSQPKAGKDFDPDDPFGDILPKKPGTADSAEAKPEAAAKPKLELDPTKWQPPADTPTPKKPATPPELPSKPAPRIDDGSTDKLEESLKKLPKEPSKKSRVPFASIAIILALVLVIGAIGAGIWFVLGGGEDTLQATESPAAPSTDKSGTEPKGPISKAKETIAQIPDMDIETIADGGIIDTSEDTAPEASASPPPAPQTAPPAVAPAPELQTETAREATAPPSPPSDIHREAVSKFLSDAQIGAVRTGNKARVMLNGISYTVGEEVQASTGLRFVGTKDGRLVFRDENGIYYVKSF